MKGLIVTNNPRIEQKASQLPCPVVFVSGTLLDVFFHVRDRIHLGHHLYTHPLSGSVKPNETIYKSVIVSEDAPGFSFSSLQIMEQAILLCNSFPDRGFRYAPSVLADFQLVDEELLNGALESYLNMK